MAGYTPANLTDVLGGPFPNPSCDLVRGPRFRPG
jgi:hypothetical protein